MKRGDVQGGMLVRQRERESGLIIVREEEMGDGDDLTVNMRVQFFYIGGLSGFSGGFNLIFFLKSGIINRKYF